MTDDLRKRFRGSRANMVEERSNLLLQVEFLDAQIAKWDASVRLRPGIESWIDPQPQAEALPK